MLLREGEGEEGEEGGRRECCQRPSKRKIVGVVACLFLLLKSFCYCPQKKKRQGNGCVEFTQIKERTLFSWFL